MQYFFRFKNEPFSQKRQKNIILCGSKRSSFITDCFELQFDTAILIIVGLAHRRVGRVAPTNFFEVMFWVSYCALHIRSSENYAVPLQWDASEVGEIIFHRYFHGYKFTMEVSLLPWMQILLQWNAIYFHESKWNLPRK